MTSCKYLEQCLAQSICSISISYYDVKVLLIVSLFHKTILIYSLSLLYLILHDFINLGIINLSIKNKISLQLGKNNYVPSRTGCTITNGLYSRIVIKTHHRSSTFSSI